MSNERDLLDLAASEFAAISHFTKPDMGISMCPSSEEDRLREKHTTEVQPYLWQPFCYLDENDYWKRMDNNRNVIKYNLGDPRLGTQTMFITFALDLYSAKIAINSLRQDLGNERIVAIHFGTRPYNITLTSYTGFCTVLLLHGMEEFPRELKEFLEDETILKVALHPFTEVELFKEKYDVQLKGTVCMTRLTEALHSEPNNVKLLLYVILGMEPLNCPKIQDICDHYSVQFDTRDRVNEKSVKTCLFIMAIVRVFYQSYEKTSPKNDWNSFLNLLETIKDNDIPRPGVVFTQPDIHDCLSIVELSTALNLEQNCLLIKNIYADITNYRVISVAVHINTLQLVTHCRLYSFTNIESFRLPLKLELLLKDDSILKIGIDPSETIKNYFGILPANTMDIRHISGGIIYIFTEKEFPVNLSGHTVRFNYLIEREFQIGIQSMNHFKGEYKKFEAATTPNNWNGFMRSLAHFKNRKFIYEELHTVTQSIHNPPNQPINIQKPKAVQVTQNSRSSQKKNDPNAQKAIEHLQKMRMSTATTYEECQRAVLNLRQDLGPLNCMGFYYLGQQRILYLSTHSGLCVAIETSQIKTLPPELKDLFEDTTVLKVNSNLKRQAILFEEHNGIRVRGKLDLFEVANHLKLEVRGYVPKMAEVLFGIKLTKHINDAPKICCITTEIFQEFLNLFKGQKKDNDMKAFMEITSKLKE